MIPTRHRFGSSAFLRWRSPRIFHRVAAPAPQGSLLAEYFLPEDTPDTSVFFGRIESEDTLPVVRLEIEQTLRLSSSRHVLYSKWTEVGRKAHVKPFTLVSDGGERRRVEPKEELFLMKEPDEAAKRTSEFRRTREVTLAPGDRVFVFGRPDETRVVAPASVPMAIRSDTFDLGDRGETTFFFRVTVSAPPILLLLYFISWAAAVTVSIAYLPFAIIAAANVWPKPKWWEGGSLGDMDMSEWSPLIDADADHVEDFNRRADLDATARAEKKAPDDVG